MANQDRIIGLRGALYQDLNCLVEIFLVGLKCEVLNKIGKAVEAVLNDVVRCWVVNFCGWGPWTFGIDEGIGRREVDLLDKRQGILEVLLSLAGKADDNVGRKSNARHTSINTLGKIKVLLACVLAIHAAQNLGRTRLDGKVKMRHYGVDLCHGGDGFGEKVFRVGRGKAQALDTGVTNTAKELGKARLAIRITPIGVYILTKERNLANAVVYQMLALDNNVFHIAGALAAAHVRNNTV